MPGPLVKFSDLGLVGLTCHSGWDSILEPDQLKKRQLVFTLVTVFS